MSKTNQKTIRMENIKAKIMCIESVEELQEIQDVLKFQRNRLNELIRLNFGEGDLVIFNHSSRGEMKGKIRKINKKYIQVDIADSHECWNCLPSSLTRQ
jgi:RNA processing factor Prp31